ncbi:MAG: DEAD/DEAH box helicase, partial [Alphaproteobacteria bacterium]|nr:DEAD/DEAH box helicase [Alphaproteobacteria bacterium]
TRTKRGADRVAKTVAGAGISADALHGNKSQGQRQRTLDAFRKGRTQVLIATDIAARGIDIDDISHVVNFDLPMVPEAYVHRIGRTARAGKSGQAISLCAHDERRLLRDIEKLTGKSLRVVDAPEAADVPDQPKRFEPANAEANTTRRFADDDGEARRAPRRPRRKPNGAAKPSAKPAGRPGKAAASERPEGQADGRKPKRFSGENAGQRPRSGKPGGKPNGKPGGRKQRSGDRRQDQDRSGLTRMLGGSNAA